MAIYKFKEFVQEVMSKLQLMHDVSDINVGKNKVCFGINNTEVTIRKNRDSEVKKQKTIISCCEMFPFVVYNAYEGAPKYNQIDVLNTVNAIDSYFMSELGYEPERSAICSRYDSLKFLLLPFFIVDYKEHDTISAVWEKVLDLLVYDFANQKNHPNGFNGTVLSFIGKALETDEEKAFILLSDAHHLQVFAVDCKDGKLVGYESDDDKIEHIEVEYGKFSDTELVSIMKRFIKKYYGFQYCELSFDPEDIIEKEEEKNKDNDK